MLRYTDISLFDSPAQTLVNTVNTVGVMGKGIALEFKRRYPAMFTRYKDLCQSGELQIGKLWVYRTPNQWVLNFPTKRNWRHPSRPEWIESGLKKFSAAYVGQGITSVSFPQLGCGNGGLPWDSVVQPLMVKYLAKLPIPVYIHIATPDSDFVPEHFDRKQLKDFRAELNQPRQPISFATFFYDLQVAAGLQPEPLPNDRGDDAESLPSVNIVAGDARTVSLPTEALADLWHALVLRGAVSKRELPGELTKDADVVMGAILRLPYVEPMQFDGDEGARFVPPAASSLNFKSAARES